MLTHYPVLPCSQAAYPRALANPLLAYASDRNVSAASVCLLPPAPHYTASNSNLDMVPVGQQLSLPRFEPQLTRSVPQLLAAAYLPRDVAFKQAALLLRWACNTS